MNSYPSTEEFCDCIWLTIIALTFFNFCIIESTIFICVKTSTAEVCVTDGISRINPLSSCASTVINFWLKNALNPWSSNNNSWEKFSSLIYVCKPSRPRTSEESVLEAPRPFSIALNNQ